jgi:hypothetical protein
MKLLTTYGVMKTGEPTERESSIQGESVPRARRLHREEEE